MSAIPLRVRAGRLWLDITCLVTGHVWRVDRRIDAGRGYCIRCGKNEHVWLLVPPGHPLAPMTSSEWLADRDGA